MKVSLDYNIKELERVKGGRFELNEKILSHFYDNCKIDRKFNNYLKGKSVIVVGPASYMMNQELGDFIESFDVVVRLNKGWKIEDKYKKHFGKRTDVRYHCGMEHENNGGAWDISNMIDYGVEWACIQFPKYLDYFHNDISNFEKKNEKYKMNFHCWSDLELYMSFHHYLGTRMNLGTAAFTDLIFYDLDKLHISGITFLEGGWFEGYEKSNKIYSGGENADFFKSKEWETEKGCENHAMIPQRKLLKLISEFDDRVTMDDEIKKVISK
tara:strand:- start:3707 stop:4513 length:807 start_codon:yes stop_codon:yes gene_type:complete